MKDKYIDKYGIDSLPQLKLAAANNVDVFLTINDEIIEDREELEQYFKIKIRTPEDLNKEL